MVMGLGHATQVLAIAFVVIHSLCNYNSNANKVYLVQVKHHHKPPSFLTHTHWYSHLFHSHTSPTTKPSLIYTYDAVYSGFAAAMSPHEAESLRHSDSVLRVQEDKLYNLHTTRTPSFLGLDNNLVEWPGHTLENVNKASQNVIIGVLDTGVWPESESFRDSGMPDVPDRWRGKCEFDLESHMCNKKLIGAQVFLKGHDMAAGTDESDSPRDNNGHGTHTSTTAAGSRVVNASLFGYAHGNARGMAYLARLAAYKVCGSAGCFGSDILAAVDRAVLDGVDVLSLSLGGHSPDYAEDPIATAAFTAMEKGIFVSCSAGNDGPSEGSLENVAPWIMTVGAGTLDRDFIAFVSLGNGEKHDGTSLYSGEGMGSKLVELVYSVGNNISSNLCLPGSLDPSIVHGKVVLCDRGTNARVEKGAVVRDAGGVGMILANTKASGEELAADSHLLPAVAVGRTVGGMIRRYVSTTKNPTALLAFGGTVRKVKPSPVVAAFSSRGPNTMTPEILKPDVIAPGLNVLAAWSEAAGPTGLAMDTRRTAFNIESGTSMSCPHVSGLAALLKGAHPEWSPSAIKSALMTTAHTLDNTNSSLLDAANYTIATPWAYGSGHVNIHKALSPGLVYNASSKDYIAFLCSINYSIEMIRTIVRRPDITCARKLSNPGQLNYPSFSVVFGTSTVLNYTRELTNVENAESTYQVFVEKPSNVKVIDVQPKELFFRKFGAKQQYTVTFASQKDVDPGTHSFGSITWSNEKNQVKSPISLAWE